MIETYYELSSMLALCLQVAGGQLEILTVVFWFLIPLALPASKTARKSLLRERDGRAADEERSPFLAFVSKA